MKPPPPEPEALPTGRLALVLLVTLAIAVASAVVARQWEVHETPRYQASAPEVGRTEVGRVFQRPFALETGASSARANQLDHLSHYGWVDRDHDVIHIPIERAFDAVIGAEEGPGK
jgi:hypothetical protein